MFDATQNDHAEQQRHSTEGHRGWCAREEHARDEIVAAGGCVSEPFGSSEMGGWLVVDGDGITRVVVDASQDQLGFLTLDQAADLVAYLSSALARAAGL